MIYSFENYEDTIIFLNTKCVHFIFFGEMSFWIRNPGFVINSLLSILWDDNINEIYIETCWKSIIYYIIILYFK